MRQTIHRIHSIIKNLARPHPRTKTVLVFSFHRIGDVDPNNPLHILHTVSEKTFKRQMSLLSGLGKFVSLDDIRDYTNLAKLNFAITFDDVSQSVLSIKPYLDKKNIPFTIAPCTDITDNGFGPRDKVYFIQKNYSKGELIRYIQKNAKNSYRIDPDSFSFYHFTKRNNIDLDDIEKNVITPLFERIPDIEKKIKESSGYLSWEDIRTHFLNDPLVTIANHGKQHKKMGGFSPQEVFEEISVSSDKFQRELGFYPRYFAVPFGGVTQTLALDVNDTLRELGYKGALWVTQSGNLIRSKASSQILHLSRIHTPVRMTGLLKRILLSFEHVGRPIHFFSNKDSMRKTPYEIIPITDAEVAASFANIARQGIDRASNKKLYTYRFEENPYRNGQPCYLAAVSGGRLESVGYNFPCRFNLLRQAVDGNYWEPWTRLKSTHETAGAQAFRKTVQSSPILGVYQAHPRQGRFSNNTNWLTIPVRRYVLPAKKTRPSVHSLSHVSVKRTETFPDEISDLVDSVNRKFHFSIERSRKFYQWRFDRHPLAQSKYWIMYENNKATSYLVCLQKDEDFYICDFACSEPFKFLILLDKVIRYCRDKWIEKITLETSLPGIQAAVEEKYRLRPQSFQNVYHFNPHFPAVEKNWRTLKDQKKRSDFHETLANSGRVLGFDDEI